MNFSGTVPSWDEIFRDRVSEFTDIEPFGSFKAKLYNGTLDFPRTAYEQLTWHNQMTMTTLNSTVSTWLAANE